MHNVTWQSYSNIELVYKISRIANSNIFSEVAFITTPISNSYIILYNLPTKIICVTSLYFIKDQFIIFVLLTILAR